MKMMVLRCDSREICWCDVLLVSFPAIFQSYARDKGEGECGASVMRANDGSAMRKWMGFHKGEFAGTEQLSHSRICRFFRFWHKALLATAVFSWLSCDADIFFLCGLMDFASKGNTISSTNPSSTHAHAVDLAANTQTLHIPLGLWAIKVTVLASDGLNSKFASHGENLARIISKRYSSARKIEN